MLTIALVILFAVLLVAMVLQWQRGRRLGGAPTSGGSAGGGLFGGGLLGGGAAFVEGTLTVTGVSDPPAEFEKPRGDSPVAGGDKNGDRFCTVSGTIIGPDTDPTEVYGHLVIGATTPWPQIGADMPVVYKPGKAESSWRFGSLQAPPAV